MPASSRRVKIVADAGAFSHFSYEPSVWFTTNPCEVDAWKNERLQYVCEGTAPNQRS